MASPVVSGQGAEARFIVSPAPGFQAMASPVVSGQGAEV
jgi:hypothetical protein